ncbi:MAG: AbrB/MazE/SpoVT family DNA-binding domain-containing protein [Limisphaerales bacterium]
MTTTISLTSKRQCVLPKNFCERKGLKPNARLRVTEIGEGLYITPVPEPTEGEIRQVMKLAGWPPKKRLTESDDRELLRDIHEDRKKHRHS